MNILTVNVVFSTLVFGIAARLYVTPRLRLGDISARSVLLPILLLHGLRHLGLMFLAPGAIYPGLSSDFAVPAAYGDLTASILAVLCIPAVATNSPLAKPQVWIFNLEGTIDLALAIVLANIYNAAPFMGPAYWIPAFWVPALLVTHAVTFVVLTKHWRTDLATRSAN